MDKKAIIYVGSKTNVIPKSSITDSKTFIKVTIMKFSDMYFELLKEKLVGEYLSFIFLDDKDITKDIFAEKLFDYFEKLELNTGKTMDKNITEYISSWDKLVSERIQEQPPIKKNASSLPVFRARKYYEHADGIVKSSRQFTIKQISDYSRIMMCLYNTIIDENYKEITDFEYSFKEVSLEKIISSMRTEKNLAPIKISRKLLFNTEELFCSDTCSFIITIIMFFYIKNYEISGEY